MSSQCDCVFCKIVAGEIPSACVYQDEAAYAFMDIGPVADGHVLLIPKAHYDTVDQMPASEAAAVLATLPKLVAAVKQATGCEGVNVLQNNGHVAGQVVGHVHFHIIPRVTGDRFAFNWPAETYPDGVLNTLADKIAGAVEN
jgi:histidine triad (HIT) family protein